MTMNRITERRRARKELSTVYRPTADEIAWAADEIAQDLEAQLKASERGLRSKRCPLTPAQRVKAERVNAEGRRIVHLIRRDPARLHALDLRITIRLEVVQATARMPPADQRAIAGMLLARAIVDRMIREDPRLRAMIVEEPEVARLTQRLSNWHRAGQFPADTYLVLNRELFERGLHAAPWLWSMEPRPEPKPGPKGPK
jgi:hypothetical protein